MKKRILIVDDDQTSARILVKLLGDDYESAVAGSGDTCLDMVKTFGPDLVLLDVMMPGMDGYETCRRIKSVPFGELTQVVLVTAHAETAERLQGYQAGADDYIIKPFDHHELLAKVRIHFRLRGVLTDLAAAHAKLECYSDKLQHLVEQQTREIVATRDLTVFALAKLAESRDPETGKHLEHIRSYCRILAEQLAHEGPYTREIDLTYVDNLYRSSPLHDIGKVGIPDVILLKPGRLSTSEFEIMKGHAVIGAEALESAARHSDSGGFLAMAADIARHHHERFDGSGYPDGLSGSNIPLSARITALADVYDALTSVRVYKAAFAPEVAEAMIEKEEGAHFDPAVVQAFRARRREFLAIYRTNTDHDDVRLDEPLPAASLPQ